MSDFDRSNRQVPPHHTLICDLPEGLTILKGTPLVYCRTGFGVPPPFKNWQQSQTPFPLHRDLTTPAPLREIGVLVTNPAGRINQFHPNKMAVDVRLLPGHPDYIPTPDEGTDPMSTACNLYEVIVFIPEIRNADANVTQQGDIISGPSLVFATSEEQAKRKALNALQSRDEPVDYEQARISITALVQKPF